MVCNINLSEKKNGVKIIQTAGYNGARTVNIGKLLRFRSYVIGDKISSCSPDPTTKS